MTALIFGKVGKYSKKVYPLSSLSLHNKNRNLLCLRLYVNNGTIATSDMEQDNKLGRQALICVWLNTLPTGSFEVALKGVIPGKGRMFPN